MKSEAEGQGEVGVREQQHRARTQAKLLGVGLLLALGLGYFVYTAFQGSTVYYLTVSELLARSTGTSNTMVRVAGRLVPESFQRDSGSPLARFAIADGGGRLQVAYQGVLPDLFFNENSEVVVEGNYGPEGVFRAENIIVKCPSKYQGAPTS